MVFWPRGVFALRTSRVETYQTTLRPEPMRRPDVLAHEAEFGFELRARSGTREKLEFASTTETFCAASAARFRSIALAVMSAESLAPPTRACAQPGRGQRRRLLRRQPAIPHIATRPQRADRRQPSGREAAHAPAGERLVRSARTSPVQISDAKVPTSPPRLPRQSHRGSEACDVPARIKAILASAPDSRPIRDRRAIGNASRTKTCAPPHINLSSTCALASPHFTC